MIPLLGVVNIRVVHILRNQLRGVPNDYANFDTIAMCKTDDGGGGGGGKRVPEIDYVICERPHITLYLPRGGGGFQIITLVQF